MNAKIEQLKQLADYAYNTEVQLCKEYNDNDTKLKAATPAEAALLTARQAELRLEISKARTLVEKYSNEINVLSKQQSNETKRAQEESKEENEDKMEVTQVKKNWVQKHWGKLALAALIAAGALFGPKYINNLADKKAAIILDDYKNSEEKKTEENNVPEVELPLDKVNHIPAEYHEEAVGAIVAAGMLSQEQVDAMLAEGKTYTQILLECYGLIPGLFVNVNVFNGDVNIHGGEVIFGNKITVGCNSCAKEEPKKENPKKEEPKKENPKKEEPKKEEPKKEDPKKEEPKKEDPKKEDPKEEDPKKEEPKQTYEERVKLILIEVRKNFNNGNRSLECTLIFEGISAEENKKLALVYEKEMDRLIFEEKNNKKDDRKEVDSTKKTEERKYYHPETGTWEMNPPGTRYDQNGVLRNIDDNSIYKPATSTSSTSTTSTSSTSTSTSTSTTSTSTSPLPKEDFNYSGETWSHPKGVYEDKDKVLRWIDTDEVYTGPRTTSMSNISLSTVSSTSNELQTLKAAREKAVQMHQNSTLQFAAEDTLKKTL